MYPSKQIFQIYSRLLLIILSNVLIVNVFLNPGTSTSDFVNIERVSEKPLEPLATLELINTQAYIKDVPKPPEIKSKQSNNLEQWLYDLRMCESGGNYQTNTGNGFYGAYQFMISTWDSIASRVRPDLVGVRPDLASPADQDYMIIQNTKISQGGLATQNPGCYQKLGLSQFPPE